jgi:HK97 family phage major capsid protein
MNKKKLMQMINASVENVKTLALAGKMEEAKAAKEELANLRAQYDAIEEAEKMTVNADSEELEGFTDPISAAQNLNSVTNPNPKNVVAPAGEKKDSVEEFANAARRGFRTLNVVSEGNNESAGYTVPADIQTQINTYRDAQASLRNYVTVETVSTETGSRVYQKRSTLTGFAQVAENGKIPAADAPQFEQKTFTIKKYGGYIPVTNELLADSSANITANLTAHIGNEDRVTENKLILAASKGAKAAVTITALDGIKDIINKKLGSTFRPTSVIHTNDDGLAWLDTLKASDGRYLLAPVPSDPEHLQLSVGAVTIPVNVLPNKDLASDTTTTAGSTIIPFIIGDLKEGVKLYDRQSTSIRASQDASVTDYNAFEQDGMLFRVTVRKDVEVVDSDAFYVANLTVAGE